MAYNFFNGNNEIKQYNKGLFIFLLYFSYVWLSFFPATSLLVTEYSFYYGKLFNLSSGNLFYEIFYVLIYSALNFIAFEIIFWFYRMYLSTKVYTFVVPVDKLKVDCMLFFIIRNIIYGIFLNLCFLYPFIYKIDYLINVFVTLLMVIIFAYKTQKEYSEPIISHFVFKNFCYPVFYYEIAIFILKLMGVM